MAVAAYVAHQIPGRVRLKIPAAKGRPDLLEQIGAAPGSANDIKSVEYNSVTGSILIQYAPEAYKSLEALGSILSNPAVSVSVHASRPAGGVRSWHARRGEREEPSAAAKTITSFFKSLDQAIRDATGNELDLKVILPLTAGAMGLLAFRRRSMTTPLWLTLLIFAFHSFLTLHGVAGTEEVDQLAAAAVEGMPEE